ncbi:MAG: O-antigen ligase family protein [Chloroflexota bacterium]
MAAAAEKETAAGGSVSGPRRGLRAAAPLRWLASHDFWVLAAAGPLLLFPTSLAPAAFGLLVAAWLSRRISTGLLSVATPLDLPIGLLVLMACVGYLVSPSPAASWAKLWGILLQAAVFYAVANGVRGERGIRLGGVALTGATLLVGLVSLVGTDWDGARLADFGAIYQYLPTLLRGVPGSGVPRPSDLFHPREVGATMAMLLPLPVALCAFGWRWRVRALAAAATVVGLGALALSQSLQAGLGLAVALLIVAVERSRWFLVAIPASSVALAAALADYGPERLALDLLSPEHPIGIGVALRLDIWSRAWDMVRDMPFTGVGLNGFWLVQTQFYPGYALGPEIHAHNAFLQTAVDLGLPGLLAFLWMVAAFFVAAARSYRSASDPGARVVLVAVAAGVAAYLVHGLLDTVTLGAKPVAALWAMMGLAVVALPPAPGRVSAERRLRLTAGRLAAGLAAVLVAAVLVRPGPAFLDAGAAVAHRVVLEARQGAPPDVDGLRRALFLLEGSLTTEGRNPRAHYLIGSLRALDGDYVAAAGAIERAVDLEDSGTVGRYLPADSLRRQISGSGPAEVWGDLLRANSQWVTRYPGRAELYAQAAAVWYRQRGDAARAAAALRSGLAAGAEPRGLLESYLEQVEAARR